MITCRPLRSTDGEQNNSKNTVSDYDITKNKIQLKQTTDTKKIKKTALIQGLESVSSLSSIIMK